MIDHMSIGVRDIDRARRFYDAVLQPLGYRCLSRSDGSLGYGDKSAAFWILSVKKTVAPDSESGFHICFAAPARASVDSFHAAALKAGGEDNGRRGLRRDYGSDYYAAFVVDPEGYRLEAYCGRTET